MHQFGSIIGGTQVESGQWIDVHNPFTGQQVGRVAAITPAKADAVLRQTHAAKFDLSRYDRARILNEMAAAIESRRDEVAHLITAESGLCLKDTTYEASRVCDVLRFAAIKALDDDSAVFPCDISQNGRRRRIYTTRQPLHLIAAITPFNHPMNQVVHKIAPDCGLPADMLNVINGPSPAIPDLLVKHELVDLVTFTGSSAIGRSIAERAGYKRLVLELGGSSALLVLQDADVEEAANITVAGLYKNSGQRCTAIRRILVHRSLADAFATVLTAKTAALKYGDPYDPANDMGTVISETAANAIEQRVANAISNGATLLIGHKRDGALYAPTVLDHVENSHPLVAEETFGPVAPILRFNTLDEAIAIANDTPYGLSGGVVSNHWPSIQRVISELEVGTVNVNEAPSYRLEWTPFGGIKASGLGYKEGVIETMKAMTNVKTYSLPWDAP